MWISRDNYNFLKENAEKNIDEECALLKKKYNQGQDAIEALKECVNTLNTFNGLFGVAMNMSMFDIFSYWRCPSCEYENEYNLTWQHFYKFKELPDDTYSKETCKNCGKEYYVDSTEPSPFVFRMNKGKCKNDYIRDMVLDVDENLTIIDEYFTT